MIFSIPAETPLTYWQHLLECTPAGTVHPLAIDMGLWQRSWRPHVESALKRRDNPNGQGLFAEAFWNEGRQEQPIPAPTVWF